MGQVASWRQLSTSQLAAINPIYSLFIQDDIRLTLKLTVNLGLRYDPKLGLREGNNQHTTFIAGQQSTSFPRAPQGLLFTDDEGVGGVSVLANYTWSKAIDYASFGSIEGNQTRT